MKFTIYLLLFIGCSLGNGYAQSFNKAKMDSLFSILSEKNKAMGSVAISRNGNLVYTRAIGYAAINGQEKTKSTDKTKYRIGSITKMFTGVIVFQLIEEKRLSLDDRLEKFYPMIPNAGKITIGNMLNHRSGLHNFTDDSLYLTYNEKPKTQADMLQLIAASPADFEPGSKAEYSNTNYVLLGYIAEKLTGKTYSQLVNKRIVSRLKLTDTYVGGKTNVKEQECYSFSYINDWKQEPETDMSIPAGAGAIVSTPSGLLRFIEALFAGKLVAASSLESMKTIKDGYGCALFNIPFYDKMAFGHNGGIDGFGSTLAYFPKDSVAIAYCTNGQVYPMNDVLIGILSIYFNRPYSIPVFNIRLVSAADLDKYQGVYSSAGFPLKITITREGTTMMAQATGQSAFPLEATGTHIFTFDRAGIVLEFNPEKGEMTLKQGPGSYLLKKEKQANN